MRFGSSEVWTQTTIGKIAKVVGGGTPETEKAEYWNGNIQWFTPSEVGQTKYIEKSERTISVNGLNKSSAKLLPIGTLLLSTRATVGECSIALNECTTNQGFQSLIASNTVNNEFLYYLIATKKRHFVKYACGSTFLEISNKEVVKTKIFVPQQKEQEKIATFLSKIDERIETQSKIIEDLELYKNKIAHQLIYNNPLLDKTTPLKKYATLKNGYAFKSDTYSESGNYKVITIANVTGNKYISTTDCNSIESLPKDIQSHQILKLGDILISLTGNVGRVSIVNEINCLLNQRVGVLFFTNIQLKKYLFQVLSNKLFETKMVQKGQGAAQKNIGNEDVESFLIPISNNLEYMNKITKVLDVLDEKLALEKQILEKLKEQKKFLLSNMFI